MSNEEKKSLRIVIGKAVQLSPDEWVIAVSLEGNCLGEIESVIVSDGAHIKKDSSDENMQFYVDFKTDTLDDHKINYQINTRNQTPINKIIELKQEQQIITVIPEEAINQKEVLAALHTMKTTKSIEETAKLTPISFLREAIKAVPSVKWALGVGGIISAIAIVSSAL